MSDVPVKRAFRIWLKPGAVEEYQRRHDALWPELAALLHDAGVSDYSIYLDKDGHSLFAVLLEARPGVNEALAAHPIMLHWWAEMAGLMDTESNGRPSTWPLTPVFHMD